LPAGTDLKTIADQLGHSSVVLTADTYLSVAIELGLTVAVSTARLILRAGRDPPGSRRVRAPSPPCSPRSPPDHQAIRTRSKRRRTLAGHRPEDPDNADPVRQPGFQDAPRTRTEHHK
jgi:hypothetical protein